MRPSQTCPLKSPQERPAQPRFNDRRGLVAGFGAGPPFREEPCTAAPLLRKALSAGHLGIYDQWTAPLYAIPLLQHMVRLRHPAPNAA